MTFWSFGHVFISNDRNCRKQALSNFVDGGRRTLPTVKLHAVPDIGTVWFHLLIANISVLRFPFKFLSTLFSSLSFRLSHPAWVFFSSKSLFLQSRTGWREKMVSHALSLKQRIRVQCQLESVKPHGHVLAFIAYLSLVLSSYYFFRTKKSSWAMVVGCLDLMLIVFNNSFLTILKRRNDWLLIMLGKSHQRRLCSFSRFPRAPGLCHLETVRVGQHRWQQDHVYNQSVIDFLSFNNRFTLPNVIGQLGCLALSSQGAL